jgi:hypothetical protein
MSSPIFLPTTDIGNEHTRSHDVFERGARRAQRRLDIPDTLYGLSITVVNAHKLSMVIECRRPADIDARAHANGAAVADKIFEFRL